MVPWTYDDTCDAGGEYSDMEYSCMVCMCLWCTLQQQCTGHGEIHDDGMGDT